MRVLLVVHGFPPAANGGTEVYVRDLALALAALPDTDVTVLTRDAAADRPEMAVRKRTHGTVDVVGINNTFQSCTSFADSYENPRLLAVACDLLDEVRPDVVHIQHLTCLSTLLPREIARRRIPVVLTLNDYWLLCHRGQLFNRAGQRCEGPLDDGCEGCVPAGALSSPASFAAGRFLRELPIPGAAHAVHLAVKAVERMRSPATTRAASYARLQHMREAARHVDRFLAPSATMAEWFRRFGVPADRLWRCNQGIPLEPFPVHRRAPSASLRVAFAGGLVPSKAPHVLLDAIALLPPNPVIVDLLGSSGPYHGQHDYGLALQSRLGHPSIRRLGPVPHDRMAAVLHDNDVVVVPSVWIENAPFIIREAFAAGAPVVASDLGGMAEMVRDGIDGLLFPAGDAVALADRLRRLADEPGLLAHLRSGIKRPLSVDAEAVELRRMYTELAPKRPAVHATATARPPADPPRVAAVVLNYRTAEQTWLAVRSLQTSSRVPARIFVVDNGSGDDSCSMLRASLENVEVIETGANLGFSGGCNAGIRAALSAGAEYVLLVNSDVVLAPDAIEHLLAGMRADSRLGIAGPLLLSREEPGRIASAGIDYSRRSGRMRQRASGRIVAALAADQGRVDAVSGCVMMVRRSVFASIGLLDEDYFFSFEDIDFCLRAADNGFRSACLHGSVAYHEGGRTIGRGSTRRVYFATRNHLRLDARAGAPVARTLRIATVIALNAAYVLLAGETPRLRGLAAVARGAWHHSRRRYGPA